MAQDKQTATGKAADERSPEPKSGDAGQTGKGAARLQGKDRDMGSALRSVYQRTVEEQIPDDLLELLGKLG